MITFFTVVTVGPQNVTNVQTNHKLAGRSPMNRTLWRWFWRPLGGHLRLSLNSYVVRISRVELASPVYKTGAKKPFRVYADDWELKLPIFFLS